MTGGAGYVGSVCVEELLRRGDEVVVFDNLSNSCKAAVPLRAKLVIGDTADRSALDRVFTEHHIDAVMHFAASIEAGESMKVP